MECKQLLKDRIWIGDDDGWIIRKIGKKVEKALHLHRRAEMERQHGMSLTLILFRASWMGWFCNATTLHGVKVFFKGLKVFLNSKQTEFSSTMKFFYCLDFIMFDFLWTGRETEKSDWERDDVSAHLKSEAIFAPGLAEKLLVVGRTIHFRDRVSVLILQTARGVQKKNLCNGSSWIT